MTIQSTFKSEHVLVKYNVLLQVNRHGTMITKINLRGCSPVVGSLEPDRENTFLNKRAVSVNLLKDTQILKKCVLHVFMCICFVFSFIILHVCEWC